jgi:hypothetical protein
VTRRVDAAPMPAMRHGPTRRPLYGGAVWNVSRRTSAPVASGEPLSAFSRASRCLVLSEGDMTTRDLRTGFDPLQTNAM